jgi:hypothetical protein
MGKYIVKKSEGTFIDSETGEVKSYTNSIELVKEESEPFFLTYSKQIISLYDLPFFNVTTKVFWKLLEYAEFNTGKVFMNVNRRKEVMSICNISKTSYYRAVEELVRAGIITKDADTYIINENMFWKGDRKVREELKGSKLKVSFAPVFSGDEKTL